MHLPFIWFSKTKIISILQEPVNFGLNYNDCYFLRLSYTLGLSMKKIWEKFTQNATAGNTIKW